MTTIKALLFDLDGTVADTDKIHVTVFRDLLAPLGITVTDEIYRAKLSGGLNKVIFKDLMPHLTELEAEELAAKKESWFRERAASCLRELSGLTELLCSAKKAGLKLAAVTNAPRLNADFLLDHLNIRHFFEHVVLGEDCECGKPHPMPYQLAMKRLNVTPSECVVFEDSITGITSGYAAGAKVVGVATSHPPQKLLASGAATVIYDYATITLSTL